MALSRLPLSGNDANVAGAGKVLVVDDERKIRDLVGSYLEREGYEVCLAGTGQSALDAAFKEHPDLIVLDLRLPDFDGEEVAREVRDVSEVPIIMLTARSTEEERVAGLKLGADDYLVKPFSVRELAARVAAVLRRSAATRSSCDRFDDAKLVVDRKARDACLVGRSLALTHTQFELLTALIDARGRVLSREQLLNLARGYEAEADGRTVDAHIKNLRRKLGENPSHPRFILTLVGVGYRFGLKPDA